jgi:hypothetical protein
MSRDNHKSGFTIIELLLAMGFVSALLLAIAMTVIQIGNIYNRGITYKNVDQVGSAIANDLQRSIANTSTFSVEPNGSNYIVNSDGGRLCTGTYSYVWNYGKTLKTMPRPASYNKYKSPNDNNDLYFVKVDDANHSLCTKIGLVYPDIDKTKATELIDAGQYDLALHSFDIKTYSTATDGNTHQSVYSIKFYLGTNDQNALNLDLDVDHGCKVDGADADQIYCAVDRFNILARSGAQTE